ncbi:MAG: response regulator [Spirochaetales bacterium]|nr:response regulator [Spirochaetales bacterium]
MGYRILIVDNQPLILEYMRDLLEKAGHEVRMAVGGLDAIQIACEFKPQLLFIDMVMPYIDGKRLCGILRKNDDLKDSLYILISGVAAEAGTSYFSDLADVYIAKGPFKTMSKYILDVLNKYRHNHIDELKHKILGVEEIYHREVTKELLFSHKHLEVLFSSMDYGVLEFLEDFRIIYVNKAAEIIFEQPEEELLARDFRKLITKRFHPQLNSFVKSMDEQGLELGDDTPLIINGRYTHLRLLPVIEEPHKSIMAIIRDTTKYQLAKEEVEESLRTKEMLLKEINHRIKNNLGMIGSLLNLQKTYIDNPQYCVYLDEIKGKIQSIELIHEKLYKTEDFRHVDIGSYLYDLGVMIIKTVTDSTFGVEIGLTGGNFPVPIKTAISLGLITAEVVTNAMKYGFGEISKNSYLNGHAPMITIHVNAGTQLQLVIENNGTPFPEGIDIENAESLGLILIHDLANQLDATYGFKAAKNGGTVFQISFDFPKES